MRLGVGTFTLAGQLTRLGDIDVSTPLLEVWRAPIDNDRAFSRDPQEILWRQIGLDRMQHRIDGVDIRSRRDRGDDTGRTRRDDDSGWSPPIGGRRSRTVCCCRSTSMPQGDWPCPVPRLGVRLSLPGELGRVEWFGQGPGEAYPDSALAARVGRYGKSIDEWQTPYVFPQENGQRAGVRWANDHRRSWGRAADRGSTPRLSRRLGRAGPATPTFGLTVRRWTTEDLDAARHTSDLAGRDRVYVNIDAGQNGLGTASCGPGVLPQYRLMAQPLSFAVALRTMAGGELERGGS